MRTSPHLLNIEPHILDPQSGEWVNAKVQRIAEIIADFDESLRLQWIPAKDRTALNAKPYRIVQFLSVDETNPHVITYLSEDELDHRVIAFLFECRRNAMGSVGSLADKMDDLDRAARAVKAKQFMEEMEQARDEATFLWNTPLHTVRMNGKVHHL